MSRDLPEVTELVSGACMLRGAVPVGVAEKLAAVVDAGVRRAADHAGLPVGRVERLCSAWGRKSSFVRDAVGLAKPYLMSAFASVPEFQQQEFTDCDATVFVGDAARRAGTHAHQDLEYRWSRPRDRYALTTWIALDDCDEQSGALLFSHAFERRPVGPRQDFLAANFVDLSTTLDWRGSQVVARCSAGDVVVFDSAVWHAAASFERPGRRRALAVRWESKSRWECEVEVVAPSIEPDEFGMDTSGDQLCAAIRRAYPNWPDSSGGVALYDAVSWLIAENRAAGAPLPDIITSSLEDVERALWLLEHCGGRTDASIWVAVRDEVIPALKRHRSQP